MAGKKNYGWRRFWCPRDGSLNLDYDGFLADPDGSYVNSELRPLAELSNRPCLALLGEPGMGKSRTMQSERVAIDASVLAEGGKTLWLDLRSCGSEYRLDSKLFKSQEFALWEEGDHYLHVFLDSLDECLLQVNTVAALLVDELQDYPIERLSLRIACRTAEWPTLLEEGLRELWPDGDFEAYELAPLRRTDVVAAAVANGIHADSFLGAVYEAEAEPLAIKPVTLDFLIGSYCATEGFPTRQTDLYLEGCQRLCEERNDFRRVATRRTDELTVDQRLAVAARIAAVTVYSNKYAIWTGVQPDALDQEDVLVKTLAGGTEFVGEDAFAVTEDAVREVLDTGLFSARGPEKLGWAHQSYAEFLAARYLVQRGVTTEKTMSLLNHPNDEEGRLVPQLHESAAWLANMSPEVFHALMGADPEVLLRSDVASTDAEGKAALVGTLLRLYDEGRLLDVRWAPRAQYRKLEHPCLAEQLRPYIVDPGKDLVVRRVSLDIAEACELHSLQDVAAEVALDASQELLVRKEAAHFVASVGDGPTQARLMPLALGTVGDDPDDDLKGNGLRAVWPENVGAEELFAMLTPARNANYLGSYYSFLNSDLTDHLSTADLLAALAWVEGQGSDYEEPFHFGGLVDQIMQRAWVELPSPGVPPAFARAALARLKRHEDVIKERREVFATTGEPTFSERVAADDYRRRLLLEEMIALLKSEDEVYFLIPWKTPLVTKEDVGWLVEMLRSEASDRRKAILAALVRLTSHLWDEERYELVYLAHLDDPALAHQVGRFFAPIELGSEEAEMQRQFHERSSRWKQDDEDPPSLDPPVAARVVRALDAFEAGDVEAFWADVYRFLQVDARGYATVSGAEWDMTALPGWKAADDETKARIVEAAKQYVLEGDPRTDEWFCKEVDYRPAFAGYRGLCLLLRFAPEFLDELSAEIWEKWVPIILDFPVPLNTEEEKQPHLRLVAMAYERVSDALISSLLALIDYDDANDGHVFVIRRLERCWDDRLARALFEKSKEPTLKPRTLGILLEDLLGYGLREGRDFAESLVVSSTEAGEKQRERGIAAAQALFFTTEDSGWPVLWPAIQRNDGFGSAVVDAVAEGARHSDLPQKNLAEQQVADLYMWLARFYPDSEYYVASGSGMVAYGRKEYIADWRDRVLRHLQDRGTFEACRQIERVAAELPELREKLKWTVYQARAEARRQTWVPPEPEHVLALAARPGARLVRNGDELLAVLAESLERLEKKLQGETPMALALWNEENGSYWPKDEEWLSNYVKSHLQEDLRGRGVVLNREVEIRKGEGKGRGEITDIHVDAVVPNTGTEMPDLISVIVETKGCWNNELDTAMEEQLAGRYLKDNPTCRHGLYLVGWFNCEQWDTEHRRRKRPPSYGLEEARSRFEDQARRLSRGDLRVRAFVLDTALR